MHTFLLLFLSTAYAQLYVNKTCNFTEMATSVDTAFTIAGMWYQLERLENTFDDGDCSTTTFTVILTQGNATGLDVTDREVVDGRILRRNASVTLSSNYMGVMNFTYNDGTSYDYVIIPAKSYEHESMVLYSCRNNGNGSSVWAWKLGKFQTLSPEARNVTENIISGIDDLYNATWKTISFSEAACKLNGGNNLQISVLFTLILLLTLIIVRK